MTKSFATKFALILAAAAMSGCSTVKMPDLDFLKLPEFSEEAKNISDYPKVSDAPSAPTDVRKDAAWDVEAKKLMKERDNFNVPEPSGVAKSDAELQRDVDALKAKVHAYKADDPQ